MTEPELLALLRALPLHSGADGLCDDAARIGDLVLTTDTMVEGVHYLPGDPAEDVAWKLVATNLSDLAAKGAAPEGAMLNLPLGDDAWDRAFLEGLGAALSEYGCPVLGGDTVTLPAGAPRVLTLTAIGRAERHVRRRGARPGGALYVTGTIGDAGAGLAIARGEPGPDALLARYRRPTPRLTEGRALAWHAHAMMDVSDGLLLDAHRMAEASGLGVTLDLAGVPLSEALRAHAGDSLATRLAAATAGDDYELLFAAPANIVLPVPATLIGRFAIGRGLMLVNGQAPVPLPDRLGYLHGG